MVRQVEEDDERDDRVRVDKWLWAARFFKTRALAAEAIAGGKVEVNGERAKRAKPLRPGDELRLRLGPYEYHVVVRALSARRGPAVEAAKLYEETAASQAARAQRSLELQSVHSIFANDKGRPSKKDRRALHRLKGKE